MNSINYNDQWTPKPTVQYSTVYGHHDNMLHYSSTIHTSSYHHSISKCPSSLYGCAKSVLKTFFWVIKNNDGCTHARTHKIQINMHVLP